MDDLRACDHYRGAGDLYLRRRTCVGWGRGATHWVDRVGICGRLFFGLIIYTLEFRWYNFERKNRDMPSISCFKFIVTIRNIFQQWKVKYEIKNCIFLTTTTKMTAVMSGKKRIIYQEWPQKYVSKWPSTFWRFGKWQDGMGQPSSPHARLNNISGLA